MKNSGFGGDECMKKVIGITLSLIGIIMVVISLVLKVNERVSVIGGADGPTSIFRNCRKITAAIASGKSPEIQ